MKLVDAVKGLVHSFWHDHTRPSSNWKDVLKLRRVSKDCEPHIKHLLDINRQNYTRNLGMNIDN